MRAPTPLTAGTSGAKELEQGHFENMQVLRYAEGGEFKLHYDANENVFLQLAGSRTFTLFRPEDSAHLSESYMLEVKEGGDDEWHTDDEEER